MRQVLFITIIFILLSSVVVARNRDLRYNSSNVTAQDVLDNARRYYKLGRYKRAIRIYESVIEHWGENPSNRYEVSWSQYELAFSYYKMNEKKHAIIEFEKVIELYPDNTSAVKLAEATIAKIKQQMGERRGIFALFRKKQKKPESDDLIDTTDDELELPHEERGLP